MLSIAGLGNVHFNYYLLWFWMVGPWQAPRMSLPSPKPTSFLLSPSCLAGTPYLLVTILMPPQPLHLEKGC
jgi:hypothetical protein